MANQHGHGRNVSPPDEDRWRPQDENGQRGRRDHEDRDGDENRYLRGGYWEDRSERRWDRDDDWRSSERYGHGQPRWPAGRPEPDRGMSYEARNQGYPGAFEDRHGGIDDRWSGRDPRTGYDPQRASGFGGGRGWDTERVGPQRSEYEHNLGTGGRMQHTGYQGGYGGQFHGTGYSGLAGPYEREPYQSAGHRGRGPASYQRSDERIREIICEALTDHDGIDATNIEISVKAGEVDITGSVENRQMKRLTEDLVEQVLGVKDIQNQLRVIGDRHRGDRDESIPSQSQAHERRPRA
jgi:hypothetical protein